MKQAAATNSNATLTDAPAATIAPHSLKAVPREAELLFFPVGADAEEGFAVLYRVTVLDEDADYFAGCVGFDFVHQLHGLETAEHLAGFDFRADGHERIGIGAGGDVERADDRRLHDVQVFGAHGIGGGLARRGGRRSSGRMARVRRGGSYYDLRRLGRRIGVSG